MNEMTISSTDLFDCSAKFHSTSDYTNDSTKAIESNDCFEYFRFKQNIFANKEFGICYELTAIERTIRLEYQDYIDIFIKLQTQHKFACFGRKTSLVRFHCFEN